jgi:hypothetical protein
MRNYTFRRGSRASVERYCFTCLATLDPWSSDLGSSTLLCSRCFADGEEGTRLNLRVIRDPNGVPSPNRWNDSSSDIKVELLRVPPTYSAGRALACCETLLVLACHLFGETTKCLLKRRSGRCLTPLEPRPSDLGSSALP